MPPSHVGSHRFLTFALGDAALAMPVAAVRRVLPRPLLDQVPGTPKVIAGVFRHQGRVVPVLRLDLLLGLPTLPKGLYAPLLLLEFHGHPLAAKVDRVADIAEPAQVLPLDADGARTFNGCATGRFTHHGVEVTALAPDRLLTAMERQQFEAFRLAAEERLAQWQTPA